MNLFCILSQNPYPESGPISGSEPILNYIEHLKVNLSCYENQIHNRNMAGIISRTLVILTLLGVVTSLSIPRFSLDLSSIKIPKISLQRSFLLPTLIAINMIGVPQYARADGDVNAYFGVGCFWHVQHEFVEAENRILGREAKDLSSTAGYAGGNVRKNGLVCYHNLQGVGYYGKQGFGEVVQVTVPQDKIKDFAEVYISLFGADGKRPDKGDIGIEYRSLLGLPGGMSSPLIPEINELAKKKGLTLEAGKGGDADTLFKKKIWVMDTEKFPFKQAEVYHQFHGKHCYSFLSI